MLLSKSYLYRIIERNACVNVYVNVCVLSFYVSLDYSSNTEYNECQQSHRHVEKQEYRVLLANFSEIKSKKIMKKTSVKAQLNLNVCRGSGTFLGLM